MEDILVVLFQSPRSGKFVSDTIFNNKKDYKVKVSIP